MAVENGNYPPMQAGRSMSLVVAWVSMKHVSLY